MPKIYVHTPFNLQMGREITRYPVGVHNVSKDVAEHWYTKAHIGDEPAVDPDATAATDAMVADLAEREKALISRAGELDAREGVIAEKEKAIQAREEAVAEREKAVAEAAKASQNPSGKSANK